MRVCKWGMVCTFLDYFLVLASNGVDIFDIISCFKN